MFRPSLGLFESSWRFWEPKCWNAQFLPLTWPWPDTWPFKKNFKSALEPSRRDLSNAASPVSLRSLVWELAWGGRYTPPPPRSMAFGWDPGQSQVKHKMLNIFFDAPVVLCPSFGSMERLNLWRFIYGAHKQINRVLKARSQCWLTLIANDDARLHLSIASRISRKNKKNKIMILFLTKYELCCVNAVFDNYFSVRCGDDNFMTVFWCKMKEKQGQNHELITS